MENKYINSNTGNNLILEKFNSIEIRIQENILSYADNICKKLDGKQINITNIITTKHGYDVTLSHGNLFIK